MNNGLGVLETILISRHSTKELTVLSLGFPIMLIIKNIAFGFGIGINSSTARLLGENRLNRKSIKVYITLALLAGFAVSLCGFLILPPILRLLHTPETLAS